MFCVMGDFILMNHMHYISKGQKKKGPFEGHEIDHCCARHGENTACETAPASKSLSCKQKLGGEGNRRPTQGER